MIVAAVILTRTDGSQVRLEQGERVASPVGIIPLGEVPRIMAEDGGWIEYEDTVRSTESEPWEDDGAAPARVRVYSRGVMECMTIADAA